MSDGSAPLWRQISWSAVLYLLLCIALIVGGTLVTVTTDRSGFMIAAIPLALGAFVLAQRAVKRKQTPVIEALRQRARMKLGYNALVLGPIHRAVGAAGFACGVYLLVSRSDPWRGVGLMLFSVLAFAFGRYETKEGQKITQASLPVWIPRALSGAVLVGAVWLLYHTQ